MYEYIHSDDIEYMFDIYTIKDLHKKLFSKTPFPEYAGDFRKSFARLNGTTTEFTLTSLYPSATSCVESSVPHLGQYGKIL